MDYQFCKENIDEVIPIESIDGVYVTVTIEKYNYTNSTWNVIQK